MFRMRRIIRYMAYLLNTDLVRENFAFLLFIIIYLLIVTITKFSILIGSARAYLSRNRRAITWVSNYWYPV